MGERRLVGVPAAPGLAVGGARHLAGPALPTGEPAQVDPAERDAEAGLAAAALEAAAGELEALAAGLRGKGRADEAAIIEAGAMMARDPGLLASVEAGVRAHGRPAEHALAGGTAAAADLLASIPDPLLAARAEDVRSVGRRALRHAARLRGRSGNADEPAAAGQADPEAAAGDAAPVADDVGGTADAVLVAEDLGPADLAELGTEVVAVALAAGSPTAHAAVVARSRGVPMVVGLGPAVLDVGAGAPMAVDGDAGAVTAEPGAELADRADAAGRARAAAGERARTDRDLPAVTSDGRCIRVLANAAGIAELDAALAAGAEGAGLIRTELGFLDAAAWPARAAHEALLAPLLERLAGRTATVRVLDFGGDKTPPFLRGATARGLGLLLEHPAALDDQLDAIVATAGTAEVRVLLPLVETPAEVDAAAAALTAAAERAGSAAPPAIGAMVETPGAAACAPALAARSAFLSIGTNDLTAATLGVDRFAPGTAPAHDPRVLAHVAACARAASAAGIALEVCGEAASDPLTMPLLIGLGVDELSVGAARVGPVRAWVRALDAGECRELAAAALAAPDAAAVAALGAGLAGRLASGERGDAGGDGVERGVGVVAFGTEP